MKPTTTQFKKGLSKQDVQLRIKEGKVNSSAGSSSKSYADILRDNVFTFFNLVNFILAGLLIYVGSYRNLLFLGVVISNMLIGIFQEVKAKRTIDKLSLIARAGVNVIRDGIEENIPDQNLVEDDIAILSDGDQIPADAEVLDGQLEVNESLLTGESDPVVKQEMDTLLSGSFVISGQATVRITKVGKESYAGKLSSEAKTYKKTNSEIQGSLDILVKSIAFSLIPIGILMFCKDYFIFKIPFTTSVVATSAALIALIPSGLVLLVSTVFVISVIKLSRLNTLVQKMSSTETLARVDVLCLDKTGTITEGRIALDKLIPLNNQTKESINRDLMILSAGLEDKNETITAVRNYLDGKGKEDTVEITHTVPFSSARKYSGISYTENGKLTSLVFGAPTFVFKDLGALKSEIKGYTNNGYRVLVLAQSDKPFEEQELPEGLKPSALLIFSDVIRKEAPDTLNFFKKQGVALKIISGDDPATVAAVSKRAGLEGADNYVDATTLDTDEKIRKAIKEKTIFGRVTPEQKKKFIQALKDEGHTVAMTGDGVNDVLALKEADTSIAMASGSDAARSISNLVLLDSNFASLPAVVAEGRQLINNLQRSSALYLSKTIFSILASITFIVISLTYPFSPIQLTLINGVTIGLPSFVLALEPNSERVTGRFFTNVLTRSYPAGLANYLGVVISAGLTYYFGFSRILFSTLCVFAMVFAGFILIYSLCKPFNLLRKILMITIISIFAVCVVFFRDFFYLATLNFFDLAILGVLFVVEAITFYFLKKERIANRLANATVRAVFPLARLLTKKKNKEEIRRTEQLYRTG